MSEQYDGDCDDSRKAFRDYDLDESVASKTPWQVWRDACAWQARRTVSGQEADEALGLATALEQQRALHIVLAVRKQGFSKSESGIPTQAESVFDLACEEIEHRLRTEVWELGGIAAPIRATELSSDLRAAKEPN